MTLATNNADEWAVLASAYFAQGQHDEALDASARALEIAPTNFDANHLRAQIFWTQGLWENVIASEEAALPVANSDRQRAASLYLLGRALSNVDEHELAITYLHQATSLEPNNAGMWVALALAYARHDSPDEAIDTYRQALKLDPNHYWANHLLARLLSAREEWTEVIILDQRAEQVAPNLERKIESMVMLAQDYAASGDAIQACSVAEHADKLSSMPKTQGILEQLMCNNAP